MREADLTPQAHKELRKRLGVSQAELAERLGMHVVSITKRETGKSKVKPESIYALRYLILAEMYEIEGIFE